MRGRTEETLIREEVRREGKNVRFGGKCKAVGTLQPSLGRKVAKDTETG